MRESQSKRLRILQKDGHYDHGIDNGISSSHRSLDAVNPWIKQSKQTISLTGFEIHFRMQEIQL